MSDQDSQVLTNADAKAVSFFEFWPMSIMYFPVVIQWLWLAIINRSLTLPLIANPCLPVSGMVGVGKSELFIQAEGDCKDAILTWVAHDVTSDDYEGQVKSWLHKISELGIQLPFVCKPDIGCRGSGVKLISEPEQLLQVISCYPVGTRLLAQQLASWEPEVGIFYVREPGQKKGKISSLTYKHTPYVTGDGQSTLKNLVAKDPRAGLIAEVYEERHSELWHQVIPAGEDIRLVFSASHCRGAVFQDAREDITADLSDRIDSIMSGLPEFYYGRLDVKFSSIDALRTGRDLEILEINGASAESIYIWDKNTTLSEAFKALLWQYRKLFQLGAINRERGFRTPGIGKLLKYLSKERSLAKSYPPTD